MSLGVILVIAMCIATLFSCIADIMFDIKLTNSRIDYLEKNFYDRMLQTENKFKQLDTKYSVSSIRFKKLEKEIDK